MWKNYVDLPLPVHILCIGSFINRAGSMLVPFLTIYLQEELHLGAEFATRAMGAYGAGALVSALFGGHLADRIGRRVVMLVSLLGGAGILMLFGLLRSPWAIIVASAAFALVVEMYRPAASAMIGDLVDPKRRSHAFGLMYVAINLGFTVAPIIGGMLTEYSFQWLFWGDALTSAIYAMIILLAIRETLPLRQSKPQADLGSAKGDGQPAPDPQMVGLAAGVKHILRDRAFICFCIATFCVANVFMQALSTFPLYLMNHGIGPATYGKIIAVNGILIVCLQLPMTTVISGFNRATVMVLGAVVMAVGFGLNGMAVALWQFVLIIVIWTFGEMMMAPLSPAIVTDLAPVHLRGRYMGAFSVCFSAALMIGVPIGGIVLERLGGACLWGGTFGLSLLGAALYWAVRRQIAPVEDATRRRPSSP